MTYNIGFLSGMTNNKAIDTDYDFYFDHLEKAIETIDDEDPDIIGFQEIDFASQRSFYMNQLDSIGLNLGYGYGAVSVNWDKNYIPFPYWPLSVQYGEMISGQGLLSKYPILENQRIVLDKPENNPAYYNAFYIDRLIQVCKLKIGEREMVVLNVHLEAYDRETRQLQGEALLETYRKYASDYPVLIIGDFNAQPEFYKDQFDPRDIMIHFNSEPGLHPAVSADNYYTNSEKYYTFSSEAPSIKIDYIYHNDFLEPISARVMKEAGTISDHLPFLLRFKFKDELQN